MTDYDDDVDDDDDDDEIVFIIPLNGLSALF